MDEALYAALLKQKVLESVSSLKRATGIPDSPKFPDAFSKHLSCELDVYTTDRDSAYILSNLIEQSLMSAMGKTDERKNAKENEKRGHSASKIRELKDGHYVVEVYFPPLFLLAMADRISEKAQSLIAPDKKGLVR